MTFELVLQNYLKDAYRFSKIRKDRNSTLGEVAELYDRLCQNFADRPAVLLHYGEIEMNRPLQDNRPELYYRLISAAYQAPKFKNAREQGLVTLFYARMLHQCGMPVEASYITRKALELLKDTPEYEEAKVLYSFFARTAKIQHKLQKQKK